MERLNLPGTIKQVEEVLFFPCEALESRKNMEAILTNVCIPLTCWQHCADWFVCRQFLVTGTAAQKLALKDKEA